MGPDSSYSADPYASPQSTSIDATAGHRKRRVYRFLCITCVVLGGLGIMSSLTGLTGLVVGRQIQQFFGAFTGGGNAGGNQEVQELQQQMQEQLYEINTRFFWPNLAGGLFHLLVGCLLLLGGIKALSGEANHRRLLQAACLMAITYDMAHGVLTAFQQMEVANVVTSIVPRMIEAEQGAGSTAPPILTSVMQIMMLAGIVVTAIWKVAKITFYSLVIAYVRLPPQPAVLPTVDSGPTSERYAAS